MKRSGGATIRAMAERPPGQDVNTDDGPGPQCADGTDVSDGTARASGVLWPGNGQAGDDGRLDRAVCLCFGVSQRKVIHYCRRERPSVASRVSACLGAGTGCGWCVPFLRRLHRQVMAGDPDPGLPFDPEQYARQRAAHHATGRRDDQGPNPSTNPPEA